MNIYVGNLSFDATEADVKQTFEAFGQVTKVSIIKDKMTGKPRGFAFVEMSDSAGGKAAIAGLDGKSMMGRTLKVNEAQPQERSARPPRRD